MALLKAKTESGMVEGLYSGNPEITVFKGIPYAAPPVDQLRWDAAAACGTVGRRVSGIPL